MHATNEPANDHHPTPAEAPLAQLSADWINDWHLMLDLRPKGVPRYNPAYTQDKERQHQPDFAHEVSAKQHFY